jgi:hypothetical protein
MAKVHLDRINKRYGWTGGNYRELMGTIIAENTLSISHAVARTSHDIFSKEFHKLKGTKEKIMVLPDITEVVPKRSVFIRKGAERGKLISDSLRDKLAANLREVMNRPEYMTASGQYSGRLKRKIINDFESEITKTFENYTRKDPSFGVPSNVHAIAVTEIRSTVDQVKAEFMDRFLKKNPEASATKTWIHNSALAKNKRNVRKHHLALNNVTIPVNKNFITHDHDTGQTIIMPYPHHHSLPPEQIISCHCEAVYRIKKSVPDT